MHTQVGFGSGISAPGCHCFQCRMAPCWHRTQWPICYQIGETTHNHATESTLRASGFVSFTGGPCEFIVGSTGNTCVPGFTVSILDGPVVACSLREMVA